ncbi:hypothetical protein [Lysinibacillus fusiformis]|uniref:hypothetical protein n=1 Tax=Lysinibacillus fusiformis TaxID=28031 RepID=UPI000D3BD512|nr:MULTISPECIES: hypothetical protein [Lysinibacillus]MED4668045.1 hypothetical protein [Lysinibacillus fusiformis]QAS58458.1 hypothetical protein LSP_20110 [Lysinibacillus sphaericus]RDV35544.1 hypothetical protein C7B90_03005 [Lysinibacillus fusiformis]GED64321.1 hypothetical protein LFU01_27730 [Lysinibacillus fusiformis]
MAKFNIEVELDWLDEEMTLDEEIQRKIISGIQNRLTNKLEEKMEQQLSSVITEKVNSMADDFISKIMTDNIANIKIPYKTSSWGSNVEYMSLSEYMGKQFEKAVAEKTLTKHGEKPSYRDDAKYSIVEYLTQGYIAKELNEKVADMIREAKTKAEKTLISNLEANLQQQLNADMLKRLNIPQLLQNLHNTIECEVSSNE